MPKLAFRQLSGLAERVESSVLGRVILSVVGVVLVAAVAAWNIPAPDPNDGGPSVRRAVLGPEKPLVYALGLDQYWNVFAPPRKNVIRMSASISYPDGTRERWTPPTDTGDLIGAYRDYRWGKYVENATNDGNQDVLWRPLAAWIAREHTKGKRRPTVVVLERDIYDLHSLNKGHRASSEPKPGRGGTRHENFFTYSVPSTGGFE